MQRQLLSWRSRSSYVEQPICAAPTCESSISSTVAALALNHKDVPNDCAIEMIAIGSGHFARNVLNINLPVHIGKLLDLTDNPLAGRSL